MDEWTSLHAPGISVTVNDQSHNCSRLCKRFLYQAENPGSDCSNAANTSVTQNSKTEASKSKAVVCQGASSSAAGGSLFISRPLLPSSGQYKKQSVYCTVLCVRLEPFYHPVGTILCSFGTN